MRRPVLFRAGSAAVLIALAFTITACASGAGSDATGIDPGSANDATQEEVVEILDEAVSGTGEERAFGASDDIVIQAVETTFEKNNARAEWSGSTLRVTMDGAVDAPTASIPCLAIESLLADGEDVILVLDDGELVCADRPGAS